jgi:hypothetical protein
LWRQSRRKLSGYVFLIFKDEGAFYLLSDKKILISRIWLAHALPKVRVLGLSGAEKAATPKRHSPNEFAFWLGRNFDGRSIGSAKA